MSLNDNPFTAEPGALRTDERDADHRLTEGERALVRDAAKFGAIRALHNGHYRAAYQLALALSLYDRGLQTDTQFDQYVTDIEQELREKGV